MVSARTEVDTVEVELVGCSGLGPHMAVARSVVAEGRLKVQFGAGYEHFELDHYVERDGTSVPVFVWSYRTWIAE